MFNEIDTWSKVKKSLAAGGYDELKFREREIWWCAIGLNLGDEEYGKNEMFERPVLIIKKFNHRLAWAVPMTSVPRFGDYYYPLRDVGGKKSYLMLSQIKVISVKRFQRYIGMVGTQEFSEVRARLRLLI